MSNSDQPEVRYYVITHKGAEKGPYTLKELQTMWAKGEIGGRTLVRHEHTHEERYLDQLVGRPLTEESISPDTTPGTKRSITVFLLIAGGFILFTTIGANILHNSKVAEALSHHKKEAKTLRNNYQIIKMYLADNDDQLDAVVAYGSSALFSKYTYDGQSYQESVDDSYLEINSAMFNKPISEIKNPQNKWLMRFTGFNYDRKLTAITLDGTVYLIKESDFNQYSYYPDPDISDIPKEPLP